MKKRKLIPGLIVAVVVIIALIEGSIYFGEYRSDLSLYITMVVHNVFSLFLFDPGIAVKDAAEFYHEAPSGELAVLTFIYGVAALTAQLFTATVILRAVWFGARRFLSALPVMFRKHTVIFGYNDKVEMLLTNRRNNSEQRKTFIRLITSEDFSRERELALLKEGILVYRIDCAMEDEKLLRKFARQIHLKRAQRVILFEEDALRNVSWFIKLSNISASPHNAKYYIYSTSTEVEQMLIRTQDAKPWENRLDYYFFSIEDLKIQDLYSAEGTMLHTYNMQMAGDEDKLGKYDLHLLIVGFGSLGQQALAQALSMGVFSADSRILIDVLDQNVFECKSAFENRFNLDYACVEENEISLVDAEKCDGKLQIRFHELNIRNRDFKEKLVELDGEMPITYVAVCLSNPEAALHSAIEVESYLHSVRKESAHKVPVAVRLELDGITLREVLDNTTFFDEITPIKTNAEIISLDVICDEDRERNCREFNSMYNAISDAIRYDGSDYIERVLEVKDKKDGKDDWNAKPYFKKQSNRRLYAHQKVKAWRCEGRAVYEDKEFLEEMAKMEHRRWNYFVTSEGWGYTPEKKDEARKLTPYLVNWELLKKDFAPICAYDLIALVVLQQNKQQRLK